MLRKGIGIMLQYSFMQNAIVVSFLIGILCPCIGMFIVVRRYSMMGDTLSHASLAGIAIALLWGQNPVAGAFIFTSICGAFIEFLRNYFKKHTDLILSVTLSLSIGIAITIISSGKLKTNAESYMFGSVLTVTRTDMLTILVLGIISVLVIMKLYHQLIYISYDEETAKVAKVKVRLINYIFSVLVASAVAASIRIVGVLVLSSMITLPVATAMQLEKGFKFTLVASVIFSIIDIMTGLFLSYYIDVAPGGFTAIVSVIMLLLVIAVRNLGKIVKYKQKAV